MKTALILTIALSVTPSLAQTCECPPKAPAKKVGTINTFKGTAKSNPTIPVTKTRDCGEPIPCPTCAACPDPAPPTVIQGKDILVPVYVDGPMAKPKGQPLMRYAANYIDGFGAGVGGGYRFKNGVDLIATGLYHWSHEHDINLYQQYGWKDCPKYRPVHIPADNGSYGVEIGVTIPLGGK